MEALVGAGVAKVAGFFGKWLGGTAKRTGGELLEEVLPSTSSTSRHAPIPREMPNYGSTPEGRPFTRHYGTETGPKRNIPGSVVDETIRKAPGKPAGGGKTIHFDPENKVTVVTGDGGSIVSVHKGPPRSSQQ